MHHNAPREVAEWTPQIRIQQFEEAGFFSGKKEAGFIGWVNPHSGIRYWFQCGYRGCEQRVSILYYLEGHFACRKCHNIAYEIQNLGRKAREHGAVIPEVQMEYFWNRIKRLWYGGRPTKQNERLARRAVKNEDAVAWREVQEEKKRERYNQLIQKYGQK